MSKYAIKAEGIGKKYRLEGRDWYAGSSARESLTNALAAPWRRLRRLSGRISEKETLWALRDVNFEIPRGQVVGIIGHNGSGKSTLLKILCEITTPTTGRVEVHGRIGGLLEVGTGFHPELTGRENIFLNGAILGMTRREIRERFDQIVEYSGVEAFLDTPVKRYSSGMHVRLAFSVAAHFEPEILAIDEVLAVGDARFQAKCLGKLGKVAQSGRTVLFVSHNIQAVRSLCDKVICLSGGKIVEYGETARVVNNYLSNLGLFESTKTWTRETAPGRDGFKLMGVCVEAEDNRSSTFTTSKDLLVRLDFEVDNPTLGVNVGFVLMSFSGAVVLQSFQTDGALQDWPPLTPGRNQLVCRIPGGLLGNGGYSIGIRARAPTLHRWMVNLDAVVQFNMVLDHGVSPTWNEAGRHQGVIAPIFAWEAQDESTLVLERLT